MPCNQPMVRYGRVTSHLHCISSMYNTHRIKRVLIHNNNKKSLRKGLYDETQIFINDSSFYLSMEYIVRFLCRFVYKKKN